MNYLWGFTFCCISDFISLWGGNNSSLHILKWTAETKTCQGWAFKRTLELRALQSQCVLLLLPSDLWPRWWDILLSAEGLSCRIPFKYLGWRHSPTGSLHELHCDLGIKLGTAGGINVHLTHAAYCPLYAEYSRHKWRLHHALILALKFKSCSSCPYREHTLVRDCVW